MKKTFQLHVEGKNRDRLLDAARHDIHKYARRERRRTLPEGADFWDFDCRFGRDADSAEPVHFATLTDRLGTVAQEDWAQFYIELHAQPSRRPARAEGAAPRATSAAATASFLDEDPA